MVEKRPTDLVYVTRAGRGPVVVLLVLVVLVALAWLSPAPGQGFVLPGRFVLQKARVAMGEVVGVQAVILVQHTGGTSFDRVMFPAKNTVRYLASEDRPGLAEVREMLSGDLGALVGRYGIDPTLVALARFDGRVVVTVGAMHGQAGRAQLWIDQDTFQPLRLLTPSLDVRLMGFTSLRTRGRFPETIVVGAGGAVVWRGRTMSFGPMEGG